MFITPSLYNLMYHLLHFFLMLFFPQDLFPRDLLLQQYYMPEGLVGALLPYRAVRSQARPPVPVLSFSHRNSSG